METINIEQAVLEKLRSLPPERKQEVLEFVESLQRQTIANPAEPKLSLQYIATLPLEERHQLIAPFIAATVEDFQTDTELTEFAVLDDEDWDLEHG